MGRGYNKGTATLTAATAISVAALLAAEGYGGSMVGAFLEIDPQGVGDLFMGDSSSVSAATGRAVASPFNLSSVQGRAVDPGGIWLYSATGGDIGLTFIPK